MTNIFTFSDIRTKIAKSALYLVILLAPVFFFPLTVSPLALNKQVLISFLVLAAFLAYSIDSIVNKRIIYPKSFIGLAILFLLAVFGAGVIFSKSPSVSLWGYLSQPDSFFAFLIYALAYFLASVYFKKEDLGRIAAFFFAGLSIATIFGLLQIFGKFIFPWDFAKTKNFNTIGAISGLGIFLSFGLSVIVGILSGVKVRKWLSIFLSILGVLIAVFLTVVNFQFLWIGVALAMLLMIISRSFAKPQKESFLALPLIVVAISLFFILVGTSLPVITAMPSEIGLKLSPALEVARESWSAGKFLTGTGPATFSYAWDLFRPLGLSQNGLWQLKFSQGFSFIATIATTTGILGILAILFLIFGVVLCGIKIFKRNDEKEIIVFTGIAVLFIFLAVFPGYFAQIFFIFLGMGIISSVSEDNKTAVIEDFSKSYQQLALLILLSVFITLTLVLFYFVGGKYLSAVYYEKGARSLSANNIDDSVLFLDKARTLDLSSADNLRALSQVLTIKLKNLLGKSSSELASDQSRQEIQNAIALSVQFAQQAKDVDGNNSFNWLNLANIYEGLIPIVKGADAAAIDNYLKAIELDPKNFGARLRLGVLYNNLNQKDKAKEVFQKMAEMDPNNQDAIAALNALNK